MSQPETLITLGTNLPWHDSSLYYRPWPHNTEISVHGFLPFVIVVFVCLLKVMVCQAWYLLCRSLQQQICSLFLTSTLGWHVKQRIFFDTWFVLIMWQLIVALTFKWKAKMGGGGGQKATANRNCSGTSLRFLMCSCSALLGFELIQL